MTILVAIPSNQGLEHTVLASDNQENIYDDDDNLVGKSYVQKLYYGKNWALGYTGGSERKELLRFIGILKGDKRYKSDAENADAIITDAIKELEFPEVVDELNRGVARRDKEDSRVFELMFSANSPKYGLWRVDPFGNMFEPDDDNEFDYLCLGNSKAADSVSNYISNIVREGRLGKVDFNKNSIDTSTAVRLAKRCIQAAQDDSTTGWGYDIVVVPKDPKREIRGWGRRIKQWHEEADLAMEDEMAEYYRKLDGNK
jgi:hypothetical protein